MEPKVRKLSWQAVLAFAAGASVLLAGCGGDNAKVAAYVLTVNSSNPASGVPISMTTASNNSTTTATTSFSGTYAHGASFTLTAPVRSGHQTFSSWTGCASATTVTCAVTLDGDTTVTAQYLTPAITTPAVVVAPSAASITTRQALSVDLTVVGPAGGETPTGAVVLSSGNYSSAATALSGGSALISIPTNTLSLGSDTLQAVYTPDSSSAPIYTAASGSAAVSVTVPPRVTPTVLVTPALTSISTAQPLAVTVAVTGSNDYGTPTGTVTLSIGSYTSTPAALASGSASFLLPAGTLAVGSHTLLASYTPDSASASTYYAASGTSAAIAVSVPTVITVDQATLGPAVTDQLLGMNMAYWYDPSTAAIVPAFQTAGIKSLRWPGGSAANIYHWATNTLCFGQQTLPADAFDTFLADVVQPGSFDLALAVNYGTDTACTGPGDPAEAAAWVQNATNNGNYVSHVTVGNEDYGKWETDLHTTKHDAATYASATANGYYPQIKAVNANVQVGVDVNPWNSPAWDPIVLAQAKYDFVEFHYYPQAPGSEDDTFLVQQAAQQLTTALQAIKAELTTAGSPNTPIFVGEIGSVYDDPGKQTTSITQALYAGQVLGEMMNEGVARASWWLGFGSCDNDASVENFSSALYGWQNFGGYMVFSDGLPDSDCTGAASLPAGTLLPTARAFQLFSKVAINGENALTAKATGDTTDVRVYAATHSGGVALVVFNLNKTASEPVTIALSQLSTASSVTVQTYSKALYDQSQNNVWAAPTSTNLGAQTLPLALTLDPWSMNVIVVQ
jgi:hypothetical protein